MHDEDDLKAARQLLESSGYKVSKKPAAWQTVEVVVTFKVRGHKLRQKDFIQFVQRQITLASLDEAQRLISNDIEQLGRIEAKSFSRVKAYEKRKDAGMT